MKFDVRRYEERSIMKSKFDGSYLEIISNMLENPDPINDSMFSSHEEHSNFFRQMNTSENNLKIHDRQTSDVNNRGNLMHTKSESKLSKLKRPSMIIENSTTEPPDLNQCSKGWKETIRNTDEFFDDETLKAGREMVMGISVGRNVEKIINQNAKRYSDFGEDEASNINLNYPNQEKQKKETSYLQGDEIEEQILAD